jgi:hypothetical protein
MSAPVKARPELAPGVKARPEPVAQLAAMSAAVDDESPEVPVATMAYDPPGVVSGGIFTVVGPNEPVESAIGVPRVVPCSVNVTDSVGLKLVPFTVRDPPGTEHPEIVIPIASGDSEVANAAVGQLKLNPRPTTAATIAVLRLMARLLWSARQRRSPMVSVVPADARSTRANVTFI